MTKGLSYYVKKFATLRVDRSKGIALHKPILLLAIIELISQGKIRQNQINLSAELIATFLKLWSHLSPDRESNINIGLPFFHLKSGKFWHHQPKPGFEKAIASDVQIRSVNLLQVMVLYGYFDEELFALLIDPNSRALLTNTLINTWFSDKTEQIKRLFQVDALAEREEELRSLGGKVYDPEELKDEQKSIVRDAAFRRVIVSTYNYSCALCGLQIYNSRAENIVDGRILSLFHSSMMTALITVYHFVKTIIGHLISFGLLSMMITQ